MKQLLLFALAVILLSVLFAGCSKSRPEEVPQNEETVREPSNSETDESADSASPGYKQILPEEAKAIMDSGAEYTLVDVRTQDEYDTGHIPGAILIPNEEIENIAESILHDKDALILVYCRSGRRSKEASAVLAGLGYTNVKEFGGIIDWPYQTETDQPCGGA